jgi:hypothetical protein
MARAFLVVALVGLLAEVASNDPAYTFTGCDVHQIKSELDSSGRIAVVRSQLQERDKCSQPEPMLCLKVERLGDHIVWAGDVVVIIVGSGWEICTHRL